MHTAKMIRYSTRRRLGGLVRSAASAAGAPSRRPWSASSPGGFTLVELLVVIAIIVLILAAVVPSVVAMWGQRKLSETENVLLVGGLARGEPLDNTLERLLGTDVWYRTYWTRTDLRATYRFSPNDPLVLVPMDDAKAVAAQRKNYRRDPLNPKRYGGSLVELSDAPGQPWIERNPEAPKGAVTTEKDFKSEVLGNERNIGIYLPPGYDPSAAPYPMVLLFDRSSYVTVIPTPRILNNLAVCRTLRFSKMADYENRLCATNAPFGMVLGLLESALNMTKWSKSDRLLACQTAGSSFRLWVRNEG